MSKQEQDSLARLIQTLTKAEKRHFKLYARRNAGGTDPLFLQLFDVIDKHGTYDEQQILTSRVFKKSQLANLRSKLTKEILSALRLLHRNHIEAINVREQLDFAQILYSRGMYRESLVHLTKARHRALEMAMHPLSLEIVSMEKHIESHYVTRSADTTAEELARASAQLCASVSQESEFSNLSLRLYSLYLKTGHARNAREARTAKKFFEQHLPSTSPELLGFQAQIYLFQSYIWLYSITHDFPLQYRYAQKWVDLFDRFPTLIKPNIPVYLRGLHNLLNIQYLTYRYERFCVTFDKLKAFKESADDQLTVNEQSLYSLYRYTHKLNKHFLEGTFDTGVQWVPRLIEHLEKNPSRWDQQRVLIFYYKIACLYFGAGDNPRAIEYLNRIINRVQPDFREDIQCFARVLNLIAHFELGNALLVSYQLKSVYRFLLKMEELSGTMQEIIAFLRRTRDMEPADLRDEFIILKSKLLEAGSHQFEKRAALYLDITSWLDSKIQNKPVQEIIHQNFLERHRAHA